MIEIENVTLLVALATFGLAYMQYRNERYKVKIDLFDRRYEVYESVGRIISRCITGPLTHDDPKGFVFAHEIAKTERASRLLFNQKIKEEIKMVCDKAMRLMEISRRLNPLEGESMSRGEERSSLAEEKSEIRKFFSERLTNLEYLFEGQMRLHK